MQLNREKFIKAIKFLKPAILKADQEEAEISEKIKERTFIHVKFDEGKCQLTTYDGYCGKRVILEKPQQLEIDQKEDDDEHASFLIPRETAEGFEVLCIKHKSKFEKASKRDHSLKLIEIGPYQLVSHKDINRYEQPIGIHFPNIDPLFFVNKAPVQDIKFNSMRVIDALKEFNNHVDVSFSGINGPVYMATEDLTYQAFFMPVTVKKSDG